MGIRETRQRTKPPYDIAGAVLRPDPRRGMTAEEFIASVFGAHSTAHIKDLRNRVRVQLDTARRMRKQAEALVMDRREQKAIEELYKLCDLAGVDRENALDLARQVGFDRVRAALKVIISDANDAGGQRKG